MTTNPETGFTNLSPRLEKYLLEEVYSFTWDDNSKEIKVAVWQLDEFHPKPEAKLTIALVSEASRMRRALYPHKKFGGSWVQIAAAMNKKRADQNLEPLPTEMYAAAYLWQLKGPTNVTTEFWGPFPKGLEDTLYKEIENAYKYWQNRYNIAEAE